VKPYVVLVATALALAATPAEAATLSVSGSKSCYRAGDSLTVAGTGFTPSAPVNFTLDGEDLGSLTTDAAGSVSSTLNIGDDTFSDVATRTLTATDETNPTIIATAQFLGSALTVSVEPKNRTAGRKLRIRASGFTTGNRLYAHVVRKRYRRNVFIGTLRGPCHTLKLRKRVLPESTPSGRYKVQFDTKPWYSRQTQVWVSFRVKVTAPRQPKPRPQPKPQPPPPPTNCQGYSPCIPPGPDVDCVGGSGDGPRYRDGPIYVTGSDPYDLDRDGNGVACEES
jgi:hypothetical protein